MAVLASSPIDGKHNLLLFWRFFWSLIYPWARKFYYPNPRILPKHENSTFLWDLLAQTHLNISVIPNIGFKSSTSKTNRVILLMYLLWAIQDLQYDMNIYWESLEPQSMCKVTRHIVCTWNGKYEKVDLHAVVNWYCQHLINSQQKLCYYFCSFWNFSMVLNWTGIPSLLNSKWNQDCCFSMAKHSLYYRYRKPSYIRKWKNVRIGYTVDIPLEHRFWGLIVK